MTVLDRSPDCRKPAEVEKRVKNELADEAKIEFRRHELLKEQDGSWRRRMEQPQAPHGLIRLAGKESATDQVGHS